jgi:hypothetical protein
MVCMRQLSSAVPATCGSVMLSQYMLAQFRTTHKIEEEGE